MSFFNGIKQTIMGGVVKPAGSNPFSGGVNDIGSLFGNSFLNGGMFGIGDEFGFMGGSFSAGNIIQPLMQMCVAMLCMNNNYSGLNFFNFMGNFSQICNNMFVNSQNECGNFNTQSANMCSGNWTVQQCGPYLGGTKNGEYLARLARVTGGAECTRGKCLKGVNDTLQKAYGFRLSYPSAYMAKQSLDRMKDKFQNVTSQYRPASKLRSLPPGAIVVWNQKTGHPHGHISIALGNGQEASDHIQNQITGYGSSYTVYMPKDTA